MKICQRHIVKLKAITANKLLKDVDTIYGDGSGNTVNRKTDSILMHKMTEHVAASATDGFRTP